MTSVSSAPTATPAAPDPRPGQVVPGATVVLLPTYNEAENLPPMLAAIRQQLPMAHILVIDDNSPDGTGRIADEACAADPRIHVAHRPGKQGLGVAYRFGYGWALAWGFGKIIQMDCDFSHDPAELPKFERLLDDHPVVVGSRRVPGGGSVNWPWYRQLISAGGSFYSRLVLGSKVRDLTTGYKAYRREALERLPLAEMRADGFGFQIEVTATLEALGVPIHEAPILFADRRFGQSKMSAGIFLEAMLKVWNIRASARRFAAAAKALPPPPSGSGSTGNGAP